MPSLVILLPVLLAIGGWFGPDPSTVARWLNALLLGANVFTVITNSLIGMAIVVTTLAFNFLGDGLRDALDPRQDARGGSALE